jgi:hypothetical protein
MNLSKSVGLGAMLLFASEAQAENPNPGIVPIDHSFHGMTYAQWAGAWQQWEWSIPYSTDPILDTTGEWADLAQSGAVWFLAGTYGETATRTVTIPNGKFLFFPIVNNVWVNLESLGDEPWSPEQRTWARRWLRRSVAGVDELSCEIDGNPVSDLESYGVLTREGDEYMVTVPDDNFYASVGYDLPAGSYGPTMDVGVYLMLRPLSPGEHTIHFAASDPAGFALDVTYYLTVEPGPRPGP